MAKDVAISKKIKISQAQQYMLLSVFGAAVFLGVAISLVSTFIRQISFNSNVIAAEEQSIAKYSELIKNIGICKAPKGSIYSSEELKNCDPDAIEVTEVNGSLRANILEELASNEALNSVPKESNSNCKDQDGKQYTYRDLMKMYKDARGRDQLVAASQRVRTCSALRVIPDALPAFRNEEALLASLNQLFLTSEWEPESISPTGETALSDLAPGLNTILVNLSIEADSDTTMDILTNIERSIREFNVDTASIEWGSSNTLELKAKASAYYMDKSFITESNKNITEGK